MKKNLLLLFAMILGMYQAQTYYSENFDTSFGNWARADLDGDGYNWMLASASSVNANFGSGTLISYSYYNNVALTPDNLITSPLIDLTSAADNLYLFWDVASQTSYPAEKYSIYITTTNSSGAITSSTPVFTETLTSGTYKNRYLNISSYMGQQVYVSIRHYGCTDQYYLFIDNVKLRTVKNYDAAVTAVTNPRYGIQGSNYIMKATIKNNGLNAITGLNLNWNDGTDHTSTVSTNIAFNNSATVTVTSALGYPSLVDKNINVSVTAVNGNADQVPSDNTYPTHFNTVSTAPQKRVLIEEGTGTWCGWCPRGAVAMEYMNTTYPDGFVGVAVHNGDPMVLAEYNSGAKISSFPGMNVDRAVKNTGVSQSAMESQYNSRSATIVAPAELNASGSLNNGNELTFNASATFRSNFANANLKFGVILMEDGVTGTASGYNQTNYYAGGANGAMGGYESLPNPVPAAQMVYDHVGRMLLGGYTGQAGSIPTTIADGQTVNYTFTATIPSTYNPANMKAVLVLLDTVTGEVENVRSFLLSSLGVDDIQTNENYLTLYPNPTSDFIKVQAMHSVDIAIYDAIGNLVLEQNNVVPDQAVSVAKLAKGAYFVKLSEKNAQTKTQKLIIK